MPTKPQGEGRILSPEECEEIRQREAVATPGPWRKGRFTGYAVCTDHGVRSVRLFDASLGAAGTREDIAFAAAARTDVPDLLATVEALRRDLERAELERWAVHCGGWRVKKVPDTLCPKRPDGTPVPTWAWQNDGEFGAPLHFAPAGPDGLPALSPELEQLIRSHRADTLNGGSPDAST